MIKKVNQNILYGLFCAGILMSLEAQAGKQHITQTNSSQIAEEDELMPDQNSVEENESSLNLAQGNQSPEHRQVSHLEGGFFQATHNTDANEGLRTPPSVNRVLRGWETPFHRKRDVDLSFITPVDPFLFSRNTGVSQRILNRIIESSALHIFQNPNIPPIQQAVNRQQEQRSFLSVSSSSTETILDMTFGAQNIQNMSFGPQDNVSQMEIEEEKVEEEGTQQQSRKILPDFFSE